MKEREGRKKEDSQQSDFSILMGKMLLTEPRTEEKGGAENSRAGGDNEFRFNHGSHGTPKWKCAVCTWFVYGSAVQERGLGWSHQRMLVTGALEVNGLTLENVQHGKRREATFKKQRDRNSQRRLKRRNEKGQKTVKGKQENTSRMSTP